MENIKQLRNGLSQLESTKMCTDKFLNGPMLNTPEADNQPTGWIANKTTQKLQALKLRANLACVASVSYRAETLTTQARANHVYFSSLFSQ